MRAAVEFEALQAAGGGGSAPDATAKGGTAKGVEPGNWVESPMAEEDAEGVDARHIPNYRTPTLSLSLSLSLTLALTLTLTLTRRRRARCRTTCGPTSSGCAASRRT